MHHEVTISGDVHDAVVRWIAVNRFPFPDQTDWPREYVTITNETERKRGIETSEGMRHPDIVIVDSTTGQIVEIGEVEVEAGEDLVAKWRVYAARCKEHSTSGRRHFFVYVPDPLVEETRRILDESGIAYGGLRAYEADALGNVRILPVVTPVDQKDHR